MRILILTCGGGPLWFQGTVDEGLGAIKFDNKVIILPVHLPD